MTSATAYLHTWHNRPDGSKDCLLTVAVPVRCKLIPHRATAKAEASIYQIKVAGRWRRVWGWYAWPCESFIGDGLENRVQITPAE